MKNLTWQNPEQLFVAQELINKVKSKCCGIKGEEINERKTVCENPEMEETFALHDEETEKHRILKALQQTGNNKTKAATLLGIDRKTLYNKLKLYQIPQ